MLYLNSEHANDCESDYGNHNESSINVMSSEFNEINIGVSSDSLQLLNIELFGSLELIFNLRDRFYHIKTFGRIDYIDIPV